MLASKSARAFLTAKGPIRHGSVKLPGSPSFWGRLFWITAEHSSLSLTEESAFLSFSLCKSRSFKTFFWHVNHSFKEWQIDMNSLED
ncbi:hypothetical protein Tco_0275819 [Tanacetum coccineum]